MTDDDAVARADARALGQYDPDADEWAPALRALGKEWCRPCREWHRAPECWIDVQGVSRFDQPNLT